MIIDKPKKIALIFGTRPEAVKMAPVVIELRKHKEFETKVFVTAQHREMLDQVLKLFDIVPDKDLNIMKPNQTLTHITTSALEGLEKTFFEDKPDLVLVQGDTTTSFVAALAAFYEKIPVGHVEAGLRTDNKYDPFPEEINRRLITTLADLNFAPTLLAKHNLIKNGVNPESVYMTGNTVIDALLHIADRSTEMLPDNIKALIRPNARMILVEAHRRENLGQPMDMICNALRKIVEDHPDTQIIFPVHRNPKVRDSVFRILSGHERIALIEPVDYPVLVALMKQCYMILTDSGGIQEEAPSLGKPVLVLRRTTERPEGVDAGAAKLVGVETDIIYKEAARLLNDKEVYCTMAKAINPYGDGQAGRRTAEAILHFFGFNNERPEEFDYRTIQKSVSCS